MADASALLDIMQLEYHVVRLRNTLFFMFSPKGDPRRRKYFVIGHPRTGTLALHQVFEANGITAQHSAGNWKPWRYDAFSDRGNYQPFERFARAYPDARFLLNTRPAAGYLRSRMNHFAKSRRRKGRRVRITPERARNELLQRNRFFLRALHYFDGDDRLTIVNVTRPGAMAFLCERLALEFPGDRPSKPKARQVLTEADEASIDAAFESLGIAERKDNPFIFPELLNTRERRFLDDFLSRHDDAVYL
ncbi:hypothetical protein H0Z60_18625 [Ectothiorhodospiraceae bacterium WFHF3C12]|nr:hypothetical protein [Ectothiorhodospiraceae bacterium WFHF3C12]